MKLTQCDGRNAYGMIHQYDPSKHPSGCPHCGVPGIDMNTISVGASPAGAVPGATVPLGDGRTRAESTIVYRSGKTGRNPVVGWLVCVKGAELGKDYGIRTGNNGIGRDASMDICVRGDMGISAIRAAVISYEPKHQRFTALVGDGRTILYVNGEQVLTPTTLQAYDRLELGSTELLFVPLCSERFKW